MRTRIISAFPGTGKSTFHKEYSELSIDSDSSNFSWIKDEDGNNTKERNPEFPQNYIKHIKSNIGKYYFIFVSSHEEVRNILKENCLHYYIIYPNKNKKDEFIKRYKNRNNDDNFINILETNWDNWLDSCANDKYACTNIEMKFDFLKDEINNIISDEEPLL